MFMFSKKPNIKTQKEIKINNNIKKIYFTYDRHKYLYAKESNNNSYLINIFEENDILLKYPIYSEQNDGKNIIVERNYFLIDDDFYKQLQKQKMISNKYKISKNRIVNKLEYFYEKFKDIENVPILQCTFGEYDYDHYFYDNRLKYFFKINGKSYRLIREIEKQENIKREIFIVNNLDKDFMKIDLMEFTKIENNNVIVKYLCSDFGNDIENGIRVGGVDVDEYNKIVEVINRYFHKNFEKKPLNT